jgi:hypothetical protein
MLPPNPNLYWFKEKTGTKHAFQVITNAEFFKTDCFQETTPIRVPAQTFLSQLV